MLLARVNVALFSLRLSFLNEVYYCGMLSFQMQSELLSERINCTTNHSSLLHDSIIYLANLPHNQMNITAIASRINNYVYHYILFKYSNIYIHYLIHIYHLIKYTLMDHIYSDLYITFMVCAGTPLCRHK